jgi:hypothetical protein
MRFSTIAVLLALFLAEANSFVVMGPGSIISRQPLHSTTTTTTTTSRLYLSAAQGEKEDEQEAVVEAMNAEFEALNDQEKMEAVGNLVADDEWQGLSMELSELVRVAVVEDLKKNAREFLGKEEYKVGDISKEIDTRVKEEVAKFRGKDGMFLFLFLFLFLFTQSR